MRIDLTLYQMPDNDWVATINGVPIVSERGPGETPPTNVALVVNQLEKSLRVRCTHRDCRIKRPAANVHGARVNLRVVK